MADAVTFIQAFDLLSRSIPTKSANTPVGYQKEANKIDLILKMAAKGTYEYPFVNYMRELQKTIAKLNESLSNARHIASIEIDQAAVRFKKGDITEFEYDLPYEKFDIIERIFDTQMITICLFFLDKFLEDNEKNKTQIGTMIRNLQKKWEVLDLERYMRKREQLEQILKSNKRQIEKKLPFLEEFLGKEIKSFEKIYADKNKTKTYTNEQYLNGLKAIEHELNKLVFVWWHNEEKRWTINDRPAIRQTLWVVRHAQKGNGGTEDEPLTEKGEEQAKELGKWFKTVPITKVFASPFQRTMQTAASLLGEDRRAFIHIEPGLSELEKPCDLKIGHKKLSELYKDKAFPTNPNYWPVYSEKALKLIKAEREESKRKEESDCHFVIEQTLRRILTENKNAEHIVLVSHRDVIGHVNELLGGNWAVVDVATVNKYVQYANGKDQQKEDDDILSNFVIEHTGVYVH
ncbi:hypothetical protein niasHT_038952 [Heterodera trifolii]|uniref:Phosphoglycerate mutase n=1 Tax=Heterodera trifolii TaxID=157864 RepID=A0ABD2IAN2_9BILA